VILIGFINQYGPVLCVLALLVGCTLALIAKPDRPRR